MSDMKQKWTREYAVERLNAIGPIETREDVVDAAAVIMAVLDQCEMKDVAELWCKNLAHLRVDMPSKKQAGPWRSFLRLIGVFDAR